ncbi:MAG: ATP-binding protein [Gammaproteobacteria bacterium]
MSHVSIDSLLRSSWSGLVVLMLVLLASTFVILEQQREHSLQIAMNDAKDDMRFIKYMLNAALQQQDFEQLSTLVSSWGGHVRGTQELKVTAANGFVFGHYQRETPATRPYGQQETINYSYRGTASLVFIKDLGSIDANIAKLRWQLIAGLILVGLVFWRITWLSVHRKREAHTLDRTNQRLLETAEQLDATRAYLKNVFDFMPSTLVAVDANECISMWNKGAEKETGLSADTVNGKPFSEVLPDFASRMHELEEAIATGIPARIDRHITHPEGTPRFFEIVIYPLGTDDSRGAVVRIDDITRRVQMDQLMVQTEKMMTVGGLAAGMADEINNPLSGVLQSSQNILRRLSTDLPANNTTAGELGVDMAIINEYLDRRGILGFLEGIREAAERASRIVADMLAFSHRSQAEFSPVSINELLDEVVRIAASDYDLKKTYDFKKITIIREYSPDLPHVACDRTEIEQVLLNLIKNAAHAMADRKNSTQQRITLRTIDDGEWARIEVEDTGPGMDEEIRSRVFEPFFTTKPIGLGTGLGLSVSYYIITEQHNGTISVDSVLGEGSKFVIRLPYE